MDEKVGTEKEGSGSPANDRNTVFSSQINAYSPE